MRLPPKWHFTRGLLRLLAMLLCLEANVQAAGKSIRSFWDDSSLLFSGEFVPALKIEIDEAGMNVLRANTSNRHNAPNRSIALATVREGTNLYRGVAIHLKGSAGSFREVDDQPAFTLHFDHTNSTQRFYGLEKIHLNNSVQDPSFMCEVLGRELFNATTVPAPRAGHATVTLNGNSLGLYVLVEGANKQFLKRHFPDVRGNYYEGAFRGDIDSYLEVKSGAHANDRSDLIALVAATREPDLDRRFTAMARVLDVERFATLLALEVLIGHWDGYGLHQNNYRLFHDNTSGRLIFLPHGMDQLFGLRRREFDTPILPFMEGLVAAAFLETRGGRRLYLDRMAELHAKVFDVPALTARVDKLAQRLRPFVHDGWDFESRASLLKSRLAERSREVYEQLAEIKNPTFDERGEASLAKLNFSVARRGFSRGGRGRWRPAIEEASRTYNWPRAVLLLESGRYRWQARVRAEVAGRSITTNDVILVSSARGSLRSSLSRDGWFVIEHEFTLAERDYVDLGYGIRTSDGLAAFDHSSLKLVRLTPARP